MAGDLLKLCVRCDEFAPKAVREAILRLPDVGWVKGDLMLVASELVTNAVVHSQCTEDELLSVTITRNATLRISVIDPGFSGGEAEIANRLPEFGGLGLKVVAALAPNWGAERIDDGYRVWAELEAPAQV
jgi:two-component sensor histidine kinase